MDYIYIFAMFTLGILIGSFLNVAIYRIPSGESIVLPASKCQTCKNELKWYHNIPVFSWVFLRGKCSFCKSKISKQYPAVEIATGLLYLAAFLIFGLTWYLLPIFIFLSYSIVVTMIIFNHLF